MPTTSEVHAEFNRLLAERHHLGFRNWIGGLLLEPRNPFQATRRRPKRWVAAMLGLAALAALNLYYFHLR